MKYMPKVNDLFDDMFADFFPRTSVNYNVMRTDIHEKDGYYFFDIDLPGYNKEDVSMNISEGYLNIKAEHNFTNEETDAKGSVIRSERSFGSCSRSFYVGESIKAEDIKAKFENGVLMISLPTRETKRIATTQTVNID